MGAALNKHGTSAFVIEVIESDIPLELIAEREIHWISHFQTYRNGYNCTIGGDFSPFADPYVKARADAARETPESKAKLNASLKASWNVKGARERQRQRSLDLWNDPTRREEQIEAMKRSHQDPSVKLAKSKISKAKWANPEWVAKRKASTKAYWTPTKRAEFGAKLRAMHAKKRGSKAEHLTEHDHLHACACDDGVGDNVASVGSNYKQTKAHGQARAEDGNRVCLPANATTTNELLAILLASWGDSDAE